MTVIKSLREKQSGAKSIRIALHGALEYLREGDKLFVTKIDRLARSVKDKKVKILHSLYSWILKAVTFST
jgi:DNA invertase Pin-like site-specific DNA recombinase